MSREIDDVLKLLLVRKEHVLCTRCCEIEPVHLGDGTPAFTFITALELMALRHLHCKLVTEHPGKFE